MINMSTDFYTEPSYMTGGYTVYGGYRRQRGGGIFGSFRTMMAPLGRQMLSGMKTVAKNKTFRNIAKKVAEKGAEVAAGVAIDALQGRNVGESIKERSREAALQAITGPSEPSPRGRKRKLKQKKRSSSSKPKPPPKKRRRQSRSALNRRQLF